MTDEVLVVGGGLAGACAAIALARGGRRVTLFEREAAPAHKVCGEFLSAEALRSLARLGVSPEALGAVRIDTVRVASRSHTFAAPLPFEALSLTRCALDEALLCAAADAGVRVLRGCNVEGADRESDRWRLRLRGGSASAKDVFLANGKHDLRGHARPAGVQGDLVAFKMYWRLAPAQRNGLDRGVELLLFRGGYAGLQPVEGGLANLCCVIRKPALRELGGRWENVLAHMRDECPHLSQRLRDAVAVLDRPLAVSPIPYGYVRRSTEPGLWALGDQAAVIPSFTGDGMSVALHSGWLAARMLLANRSSAEYQSTLHHHVGQQVQRATLLSRAMVSRAGQTASAMLLRAWPGALSAIAKGTRLDDTQSF